MGAAWLDSRDAGCPDAITFPDYSVESWEPGAPGELTLIVDSAINKIEFSEESGNLNRVAFDFICELYRDKPELSKVLAATDDGKWKETVTRKDLEDREAQGYMGLASTTELPRLGPNCWFRGRPRAAFNPEMNRGGATCHPIAGSFAASLRCS